MKIERFKYKTHLIDKIELIFRRFGSMTEMIEMGTVSSRGQICIPTDIRETMGLEEGAKVMFFLNGNELIMRKANRETWEEITRPLREAKKKIREEDVDNLIHKFRREQHAKNNSRH